MINISITIGLIAILFVLGVTGANYLKYQVDTLIIKDKFQASWLLAHKYSYVSQRKYILNQADFKIKNNLAQNLDLEPFYNKKQGQLVVNFGEHVAPISKQGLVFYSRPSVVKGHFNLVQTELKLIKCIKIYDGKISMGYPILKGDKEICQN
ncbi:MAG: hypothetical protein ACKOAD_01545 [Gammaproteobacteria bacterium]